MFELMGRRFDVNQISGRVKAFQCKSSAKLKCDELVRKIVCVLQCIVIVYKVLKFGRQSANYVDGAVLMLNPEQIPRTESTR